MFHFNPVISLNEANLTKAHIKQKSSQKEKHPCGKHKQLTTMMLTRKANHRQTNKRQREEREIEKRGSRHVE